MGQYGIYVNLDRRQYICPSAFGDSAKFLEASAGGGVLTALLALLVSGNVGGTGEFGRPLHKLSPEEQRRWPDDAELRTPTALYGVVGSWAGDRVLIAGDYGKDGHMLKMKDRRRTRELLQHEMFIRCRTEDQRRPGQPPRAVPTIPLSAVNVHKAALRLPDFLDISETVMAMLRDSEAAGLHPFRCQAMVEARLASHTREAVAAVAVATNLYHDLSWLTVEDVDIILNAAEDATSLRQVKAWLRKRMTRTWQKELLKGYRPTKDGIFRDGPLLKRVAEGRPVRQLLPSQPYLLAALRAELMGDTRILQFGQPEPTPHHASGRRKRKVQLPDMTQKGPTHADTSPPIVDRQPAQDLRLPAQ